MSIEPDSPLHMAMQHTLESGLCRFSLIQHCHLERFGLINHFPSGQGYDCVNLVFFANSYLDKSAH